jgi:filamentous hemagglutinin family protein
MTTRQFWAILLATTCLSPAAVLADGPLPTDPNVISGDVTISTPAANQMLLVQSGAYGIVDWGSFSIANGFGVQFQNGTGATLNRVTGSDLSSIMGRLDATGSVYLINQNGIVFGQTGVVNTGGTFVASTLDIENGDFLNGGDATFRGDADSYVINLGSVASLGGDVAILGRNVVNEGSLSAPNGTVGLAAGREILMRDASVADGLFSVLIGGSDTSVSDSGAIQAAAAELRANGGNVYALAGNTDGVIAATGVEKANGRVFLTAGNGGHVKVDKRVTARDADGTGGTIAVDGGRVDMAGVLDTSGTRGGSVIITSGISTNFTGEVLAKGDGSAGSGGFAEVSGLRLNFSGSVETRGGTVLIDPENIEITNSPSALLSGATLLTPGSIVALLRTQNVVIQTSSSATEAGTIVVTDAISWATAFSLSFLAHGDIWFNASVQSNNASGGDLNIVAGWDGSTSTTQFDEATFIDADLASTSLFGRSNGLSYTLSGFNQTAGGIFYIQSTGATTTAVGARAGATQLFASGGVIGGLNGSSQLGYNVASGLSGITITGDILLRSTGNVNLLGGSVASASAQIGHIGVNATATGAATVNATGNITIETFNGIELDGGSASNTYAMVGHGSRDIGGSLRSLGNRSGNISIIANGEVSIEPGAVDPGSAGWIGHATGSGTISAANILVRAFSFDQSRLSNIGAGGIGILDIAMLAEGSKGGTVTFAATDSTIGAELSLTGTTANAACECESVTTAGDVIISAAGDLSLDSTFAFSNLGGGNIALAAGADFHNNSGADAFGTMKGVWRVYSTRPDRDTGDIGTLTDYFVLTNNVFDPNDPFAIPAGSLVVGDGLVYTKIPLMTVGNASMTYGGTLVLPGFALTVDGVGITAADWGFTVDGTSLISALVTFSSTGHINAGSYANALGFDWTVIPAVTGGYDGIQFINGNLTVGRATLTASIIGTPTKVYDGTTAATLTAANFLLSGFVAGEGGSVTQTVGTYATANSNGAGTIGVSATLTLADVLGTGTTNMANYAIPPAVSGVGVITPATVTVRLGGGINKAYDGNTTAILSAADFVFSGFAGTDGATVVAAMGAYRSGNVNRNIIIDVALTPGDLIATGTTLFSNYFLPTSVSGTGTITQATLAGVISGAPTKIYDGNTGAILTAANFLLTGFVAGEGATVTQTGGTYATANASGTNLVTATLGLGDFTATGATLLANYVLPTTVTGNGIITQATVTAAIVGTPTKVYDGNTGATLTAANFLLTGFVAGEGATVTQTAGFHNEENAAAVTTVSAILDNGDFVSTGATNLANYILPTNAVGSGTITRALLTGAIIGTPTKFYDGSAFANLTAANFQLFGLVAGDGISVGATTGSYASANASAASTVTVTLTFADFVTAGTTRLSDYILPTTVTRDGVIDRAVLTASIIGLPTKPFDGNDRAVLTPASFNLIGFVAGEGATVTQTQGTYAVSTAGVANTVTAELAESDFSASGGTLLANYILPDTASGVGLIDLAPPTQPEIVQTRSLETFDTTPLGQPSGPAAGIEIINSETTQRIMDEIRAGSNFCKALIRQEFVIDCLSDRLQSVADGLSAVGEYSEVRAALENAAQQLHDLALSNASADLAQQVVRASGRRSTRPLTAVSAGALASANAEAAAIIETAGLVLLRSSSGSQERAVAFTQVAEVVNSTKVLLRSS